MSTNTLKTFAKARVSRVLPFPRSLAALVMNLDGSRAPRRNQQLDQLDFQFRRLGMITPLNDAIVENKLSQVRPSIQQVLLLLVHAIEPE